MITFKTSTCYTFKIFNDTFVSEHEGPVTSVDVSRDGVKVLAATSTVSNSG